MKKEDRSNNLGSLTFAKNNIEKKVKERVLFKNYKERFERSLHLCYSHRSQCHYLPTCMYKIQVAHSSFRGIVHSLQHWCMCGPVSIRQDHCTLFILFKASYVRGSALVPEQLSINVSSLYLRQAVYWWLQLRTVFAHIYKW